MNISPTELKKELLKEYKYKIEMHAHTTPASACSEISPEKIVRDYYELGYDALVITNHFMYEYNGKVPCDESVSKYLEDYEKACRAAKEYNLKILLGVEARFTENTNDYLIYGVDREILGGLYEYFQKGVSEYRKNVKLENSVFLQAHPFRDSCVRINSSLLDGIEVYNMHPGHNSKVALASVYAKENNLDIIIAGSDYHHLNLGHEGISALRTKVLPEDSFELAKILRSRDYIIEIGRNNIVIP